VSYGPGNTVVKLELQHLDFIIKFRSKCIGPLNCRISQNRINFDNNIIDLQ